MVELVNLQGYFLAEMFKATAIATWPACNHTVFNVPYTSATVEICICAIIHNYTGP